MQSTQSSNFNWPQTSSYRVWRLGHFASPQSQAFAYLVAAASFFQWKKVKYVILTCISVMPSVILISHQLGHLKDLRSMMQKIQMVEQWISFLLQSPIPEVGNSRVEISLYPNSNSTKCLTFALPDSTRFSLCDFPLHLSLELLGVSKCLQVSPILWNAWIFIFLEKKNLFQVLTLILLERKVVVQSHDYSALSFTILSLTRLLYPLEYVFPVIPLLPPAMNGSEQLLLVPTPYIIGVPSSFFATKGNVNLPDDVWLVDLDKPFIQVGFQSVSQCIYSASILIGFS